MKIFAATHNAHKIREISRILGDCEIVADDPGDVDENAPDFAGNASIKVRAIASRHPGEWCMADDSGLEVECLGGAPGVRSARYAGEPSDTSANNALLLRNMAGKSDRRANFTCAIAIVDPEGREWSVSGKCYGAIKESASGSGGFGYDPLFIPDGYSQSFAELPESVKNSISHRARALAEAKKIFFPGNEKKKSGFGALMRLLRIVNLPTVPGDILAGAAAAAVSVPGVDPPLLRVVFAAAASCCFYHFGMADNDLSGAASDTPRRPIPAGEISVCGARIAAWTLFSAGIAFGVVAAMPWTWWAVQAVLAAAILAYNRIKNPFLMGLCRALNVLSGTAAALAPSLPQLEAASPRALAVSALAFAYISAVTFYASREDTDPARHAFAGALVGAVVYVQLGVLIVFALAHPAVRAVELYLVAGAIVLLALRLFKRIFPKVDAS